MASASIPSLLDKLFAAGRAIQAGEQLKNPAAWKNVQLLMNAFLTILGAVLVFVPDLEVSDAQLNAVAYGLATLGGLLNVYFTAATTTKVGLPPKR
jgi:hypothetical protein